MLKRVLAAAAAVVAAVLTAHPATAAVITTLDDYDGGFTSLCGGVACDIVVAEARNGDNRARTTEPRELGIAQNTNIGPGAQGKAGFRWPNRAVPFTLSFDGAEVVFLVGQTSVRYGTTLAGVTDMYIRAVARSGETTTLSDLLLQPAGATAQALGGLVGDDVADYLHIAGANWTSPWSLTGAMALDGVRGGSQARPSVQFKLVGLQQVPEPGALALFGGALGLLALGRRMRRR